MRDRPTIEPKFFETYHYADMITSIVADKDEHLLRWNEFFCDGRASYLLPPYERESALHVFIGFAVDEILCDYTLDADLEGKKAFARLVRDIPAARDDVRVLGLPVEQAMQARNIEYESFAAWLEYHNKTFASACHNDIYEYFHELRMCGSYEELLLRSVREVFFTLFSNRTLLLQFNLIVSQHVVDLNMEDVEVDRRHDVEQHFDRSGVLKRAHMPEWVRRAVFFRDRGRCVLCHTDLSGLISLQSEKNFDHMVPLTAGGLNDVTNIQLLCAECNQRKSDRKALTSGTYEDWY